MSKSIVEGSHGRNLGAGTEAEPQRSTANWLAPPWPAQFTFLYNHLPRGGTPPAVNWTLPHECSQTCNMMEAFSQLDSLFPVDFAMSQIDKNPTSTEIKQDIYEDGNQPFKNSVFCKLKEYLMYLQIKSQMLTCRTSWNSYHVI